MRPAIILKIVYIVFIRLNTITFLILLINNLTLDRKEMRKKVDLLKEEKKQKKKSKRVHRESNSGLLVLNHCVTEMLLI